jgi:peptidoglycan/xylan/chitin deacetylase (PgdA/CDA1 family)
MTPQAGAAATTIAPIDPLSIAGVRSLTLAGSPHSAQVATALTYLDGAEGIDNALDASVLTQIDEYLGERGPFAAELPPGGLASTSDDLPARGLTIATDVILAAQSWFGLRVRAAVDGNPVAQWTLYTDAATDEVYTPADLIAGSDPDAITEAAGADVETLPTLAFAADGSIVLAAGRESDTASIDRDAARGLLNDTGREIQAAAESREPFHAPETAASPHVPCSLIACVALTYDDGPSPTTTPALLDVLADEGVPATFFVVGSHVNAHPEIVARANAEGHAVENHSWSHPDLATLSAPDVARELAATDDAIRAAGAPTPTFIRAPFGSADGAVPTTAGHPLAYWSVDAFDWRDRDGGTFVPRILDKIQPGGIILMHDIYASSVSAQKRLIDALRDRGYTFVTVPQLFSGQALGAGQQYTCRGTGLSDAGPACNGR